MIIVTQASMLSQAERVAAFHRQKDGMTVLVVDSKEIYNEFSFNHSDVFSAYTGPVDTLDRVHNIRYVNGHLCVCKDEGVEII